MYKELEIQERNKSLKAGGFTRDWPQDRGVFWNKEKTLVAWVNEFDHLTFIAYASNYNFGEVVTELQTYMNKIGESKFAKNPKWGYVTPCITDLGTGLAVTISLHLPNIVKEE